MSDVKFMLFFAGAMLARRGTSKLQEMIELRDLKKAVYEFVEAKVKEYAQ